MRIAVIILALIGGVLTASVDTDNVEKCYSSVSEILDNYKLPKAITEFVVKISQENQVLTLSALSKETLAQYHVPEECKDYEPVLMETVNPPFCTTLQGNNADLVLQKLFDSHQAYIEAAIACNLGSNLINNQP